MNTLPCVHVPAPPSKSVSHRYLLAAALADGTSCISHTLESRDLERTRDLLCAAGAQMKPLPQNPDTSGGWRVTGMKGQPRGGTRAEPLDCNVEESGTTCRLLTAVLSAGRGFFRIHGTGRMHQRPLGDLVPALRALGARLHFEGQDNCPPLVLEACGLNPGLCGGELELGMDLSSQYFSGLLLAAPLAAQPLRITLGGRKAVSWPYVGLTLQCLEDFGIGFLVETRPHPLGPWSAASAWRSLTEARPGCVRISVRPGVYHASDHCVEGDWSGTSYLLAAGALGPRPVCVENLHADSLQGDRSMLDILQKMGADLSVEPRSVTVRPSALHGADLDMGNCPDLVPTVAVLAAFAQGSTRITNAAHLRHKESDRIAAPAAELTRLGVTVEQLPDGLVIHGDTRKPPVLAPGAGLSAHNDHRIAMSLALLDLRRSGARVRTLLDDPGVVGKSFPHFWQIWEKLTC